MNMWQTVKQFLAKVFGGTPPGNWDTKGPPEDEHPLVKSLDVVNARAGNVPASPAWSPSAAWTEGWWAGAVRRVAHPGRIGRTIVPRAIVVHTTDTMPGGFAAIVKSWTTQPGAGNAATFLIGRDESDGVVQFAPITKNTNHAGGAKHGWFRTPSGALFHPNAVTVGIELDAGGALRRRTDGTWYHPDSGRTVAPDDVFLDTRGRGWHRVTPYQFTTLRQLLDDLQPCLKPFEPGTSVVPTGGYKKNMVPWADSGGHIYPRNTVGHVTLDPVRKTDPGPQVVGWLG